VFGNLHQFVIEMTKTIIVVFASAEKVLSSCTATRCFFNQSHLELH